MQDDANDDRNVIPRWHPLRATDSVELSSIKAPSQVPFETNLARLNDETKIWREERGSIAAAELFDAFVLTGDRRLLQISINKLREDKDSIPPRLRDAVISVFRKDRTPLSWRRLIAANEADESFVRNSIRIYKAHLKKYPRDGLLHTEIARLYTVLGSYEKADHHLSISRVLSPNNRYVLRSMMQFYDIVGDLHQGLKHLRRSDILRVDPWIQSAEIAAATSIGKPSMIASHKLLRLDADGLIPRSFSELAMAMATLDRTHGVKERKVFSLVRSALPSSTENGFAQAVWLSNRSTREFVNRFPDAKPSDEAYEAHVKLSLKERDFFSAAGFAELWLEDQPFSVDAMITYLNLRTMHVGPDATSIAYGRKALSLHHDNWHVMNACALLFAEAGDLENARTALSRMERQANSDGIGPFLAAAKGFVAFVEGDFLRGRYWYDEAFNISRSMKSNYLMVNALIFWLRAEAINGLLSNPLIDETTKFITRSLERVQHSEKAFLSDVWYSVQLRIASREQFDREHDDVAIAATVASCKEEPLLL